MVHKIKLAEQQKQTKKFFDRQIYALNKKKKDLEASLVWQGIGMGVSRETELGKGLESKWGQELREINDKIKSLEKMKGEAIGS